MVADELVRLASNLQAAYAERGVHESSLTEAEQVYFKARTGMVEMEDRLRKLSRQQTDLQVLINNLKDKFNDVKFEISSISQRLRIEFEIGINDILNEEPSIKRPEAELSIDVGVAGGGERLGAVVTGGAEIGGQQNGVVEQPQRALVFFAIRLEE